MIKCKPSDYYETPPDVFKRLTEGYIIEWDVCASQETSKVSGCFYDENTDGLQQDWSKFNTVWCNPPYSKEGKKDLWIKKCYEESLKGVTVIALLPVKTSTKAFHSYIYKKPTVDLNLLPGRIRFLLNGKKTGSGRFDSMLVIFKGVIR